MYKRMSMLWFWIIFCIPFACLHAGDETITCGAFTSRPAHGLTTSVSGISVLSGGRPVMRYRFNDVQYKPYVEALYTPSGINILRDSPHDHKHHHALMYAVKVNGVNFWEEYTDPGLQKHLSFQPFTKETAIKKSLPAAGFNETLSWIHPKRNRLMMRESRTLKILKIKAAAATFLLWRSRFRTPEGEDSITITGSHYHGLGMRFLRSMDSDGEFRNSENKKGTVFRGTERLLKADWCSYTAQADGKTVTVAMFSHPENPRHPTCWFTMTSPFAYLSATMTFHKKPYIIEAEKPLVLHYGIALWDGRVKTEEINALYRRWITW